MNQISKLKILIVGLTAVLQYSTFSENIICKSIVAKTVFKNNVQQR